MVIYLEIEKVIEREKRTIDINSGKKTQFLFLNARKGTRKVWHCLFVFYHWGYTEGLHSSHLCIKSLFLLNGEKFQIHKIQVTQHVLCVILIKCRRKNCNHHNQISFSPQIVDLHTRHTLKNWHEYAGWASMWDPWSNLWFRQNTTAGKLLSNASSPLADGSHT